MKIAIVTTNFPRWAGDFRVPFIIDAAKAIQKQGHILRIITVHHPGAAKYEVIDGLEVFRMQYLPENYEVLQKDAAGIPAAWGKNLWNKLSMIPFFLSLCVGTAKYAKGFDIIHANWSLSGLAAYFTHLFHKCPYIVTIHGSDIFKTLNQKFLRIPVKISLQNAEFIIAVSKALSSTAMKLGIPGNKFQIIPTGLNVQKFPVASTQQRTNSLLFVGSLIERKGVIYLLEAMIFVKEKYPEYKLLIVGEGVLRNQLETYVYEHNLEDHVFFLGTKSQQEVSRLMRKAKLFILPSIEEGQGAVLVEAMSSGTPCIGSNVGGIPDVISEDVGMLFEPGNSKELFKAISCMLDSEDFWNQASKCARIRAEEVYNWDLLASKITVLYKKVLDITQKRK
jgi:glycosyltransferase involved in cell wall biosynthesis